MNRELITIIESLCKRIEFTGHSGLEFIETKPEMCRILRLRKPIRCDGVDCINCLFSRNTNVDIIYPLKIEKLIQRI